MSTIEELIDYANGMRLVILLRIEPSTESTTIRLECCGGQREPREFSGFSFKDAVGKIKRP